MAEPWKTLLRYALEGDSKSRRGGGRREVERRVFGGGVSLVGAQEQRMSAESRGQRKKGVLGEIGETLRRTLVQQSTLVGG